MTKLILPLLLILCVHFGCSKDPAEEISQSELVNAVNQEMRGGLPKDLSSIKALADQGNVEAQSELGDKYWYGEGVDKNTTKAFNWWMKAAQQGDAGCQYSVGIGGVGEDKVTGMAWIIIGAKNGFPQIQVQEAVQTSL